jgi:hypothetical protein
MTAKADFTEEEWEQVLEAPTSAGFIVAASERGGSFKESFSIAKAYTEARQQHGESELLDEVVSTKPKIDKTRPHSPEELKQHGLQNIREGAALVEQKATPEELEAYKRFIVGLAERVAEAHKDVTSNEAATVNEVAQTLGVDPPAQ